MYFKSFKFKYDIKKHELCENKTSFNPNSPKSSNFNMIFHTP